WLTPSARSSLYPPCSSAPSSPEPVARNRWFPGKARSAASPGRLSRHDFGDTSEDGEHNSFAWSFSFLPIFIYFAVAEASPVRYCPWLWRLLTIVSSELNCAVRFC